MKVLVDMNLSPRWVGVLAGAGIDAARIGPQSVRTTRPIRTSWPTRWRMTSSY
jgi:predicted nuclease of predicted toxin-antitoxin system